MFRRPNPHLIESDAGFSVEEVAYSKLAYREGDKKATVTVEYLTGGGSIFILYLAEHDCWDPPFDTVRISDEEWKRIGDNIREAYRSQGSEIVVYMPSPEQRKGMKHALEQLKHGEFRIWKPGMDWESKPEAEDTQAD